MSITNSKNIAQTFSGLQVLLIESHKGSLHRHANQLIVHSHRVTRTTKASIGLSKILDGEKFHCVLLDAERCEMDIMEFLYCSLKNRPQLPVVVMGPPDIQKQIEVLAQKYKVVSFLRKPYPEGELCNILKQFSKERTSCGEGTSTIKCVEENLKSNIEHKVDTTLVGSSASPNATMIYNSLSSGDGTDKGLINISSQEYGAMSQPITIVDVSSNDDEPSIQKNISIGTERINDKGKKPMEVKRNKYLPIEGNTYLKKRKEMKTHITGMPALDGKFTEALNAFDKKDYPDTILQGMNVPGLTRSNHFASQLQEYKERENNMKKPIGVSPLRMGDNFQAENSYAYTRSGIPTPSTSIPETSNLQRPLMLNSEGISFMTIDSIRARLNGVTPLPQKSTTTVTNSGDVLFQPVRADIFSMSSGFGLAENPCSGTGQASEAQTSAVGYARAMEPPVTGQSFSNHVSGKAMTPLDDGATVVSQFDHGTDNYIYLNDFANANSRVSGGNVVKESFATFDRFGVPVDQPLLNTGYAVTGSSKVGSEKLYFRNMESLFDVGSPKTRNCSDTDAATIGDVSASLGIPEEENNAQTQTQPPSASMVPLNSSPSRLTEEHWSQKMIQHEPEIFTEDVNEDCGQLITGPIGYTEDIVDHR